MITFKFFNVIQSSAVTLRVEQKAERRSRILAAAREIIAESGYPELTMRDLARQARVTVPTIYNLIGSKEAVLFALPRDEKSGVILLGRYQGAEETAQIVRPIETMNELLATVFTVRGRIRLTHRRYRRDGYPIDPSCDCAACAGGFTRAYLHHLFAANEILSAILASIHNVHFYQRLVREAREAICENRFDDYRLGFLAAYTEDGNPQA